MNDTLTGDPLMTVPILTAQSSNTTASDGYEVHGKADEYFNPISDKSTTVNAFYEKAPINNSDIDLNVITKIGVRAVGNNTCHN